MMLRAGPLLWRIVYLVAAFFSALSVILSGSSISKEWVYHHGDGSGDPMVRRVKLYLTHTATEYNKTMFKELSDKNRTDLIEDCKNTLRTQFQRFVPKYVKDEVQNCTFSDLTCECSYPTWEEVTQRDKLDTCDDADTCIYIDPLGQNKKNCTRIDQEGKEVEATSESCTSCNLWNKMTNKTTTYSNLAYNQSTGKRIHGGFMIVIASLALATYTTLSYALASGRFEKASNVRTAGFIGDPFNTMITGGVSFVLMLIGIYLPIGGMEMVAMQPYCNDKYIAEKMKDQKLTTEKAMGELFPHWGEGYDLMAAGTAFTFIAFVCSAVVSYMARGRAVPQRHDDDDKDSGSDSDSLPDPEDHNDPIVSPDDYLD